MSVRCARTCTELQSSAIVIPCRIIRNVTTPLASHTVQASRPSNLDSMKASYHLEDRTDGATLKMPVFYDGNSSGLSYIEPKMHAYSNPESGSILTQASSWPDAVARSLGFDPVPQLEDAGWWSDMPWYMNSTMNPTHSPASKVVPEQRYWEWDPRFPSTYPRYSAPWPNASWNGHEWPAHLYGTLPSSWGDISDDKNVANLHNLRIM
jgi:hypothetical protein